MRYSFLYTPAFYFCRLLPSLYGGLRLAVVVHAGDDGQIIACQRDDNSDVISQLDTDDFADFDKLYEGLKNHKWLQAGQLPYRIEGTGSHPDGDMPGLFSELKNTVLCMKLDAGTQGRLLFYLHFNPNRSNFGPTPADSELGTWHKEATARQLNGIIKALVAQRESDYEIWQALREHGREKDREEKQGNNEIEEMRRFLRQQVKALTAHYLEGFSTEGDVFELSDSAAEKIAAELWQAGQLKEILRKACIIVANSEPGEKQHLITEQHLIDNAPESKAEPKTGSRKQRALAYLDKLEGSAQKIEANGEKLTGARVGAMMSQPISAPAITDALKNNSRTIVRLLDEFPERWPLIREKFRPLGNIVSAEKEAQRERPA